MYGECLQWNMPFMFHCKTSAHSDPSVTPFAATCSTRSHNQTPSNKHIRSIYSILKVTSPSPVTAVVIATKLCMLCAQQLCPREPFKTLSWWRQQICSLYLTCVRESSPSFHFSHFHYPTITCFLFFPPLHLNILKHFRVRRRPGGPGLRCVCAPQNGCTF